MLTASTHLERYPLDKVHWLLVSSIALFNGLISLETVPRHHVGVGISFGMRVLFFSIFVGHRFRMIWAAPGVSRALHVFGVLLGSGQVALLRVSCFASCNGK